MEAEEKTQESTALVLEADEIKTIATGEDYTRAATLRSLIRDMVKKLKDDAAPTIDAIKNALQTERDRLNEKVGPLEVKSSYLNGLLVSYDQEQERIRQRKQLEEEARKRKEAEEEKARLLAIAKETKDKNLVKEIKSQPIISEPTVVVKGTPKVEGLSFRELWDFEITDAQLLPREYLVPDEVAIGKVVRALKNQTKIPGIRAFSKKVTAQRG